uniref:Uncharacterized protein n=1 Tax=Arundo donax TaxID=35708 RepID=A0A0A9BIF1_ARUDO
MAERDGVDSVGQWKGLGGSGGVGGGRQGQVNR